MNPWNIIGWIIVGVLAFIGLLFVIGIVRTLIDQRRRRKALLRMAQAYDPKPRIGND